MPYPQHIRKKRREQAKAIPGEQKQFSSVTMQDIAEVCGVSKITVSRAFTSPQLVRAETRERILAAAHTYGYTYNALASNLSRGNSHFFGLIASVANDSQLRNILQATHRSATLSGFEVLLGLTEFDEMREQALIERYIQYRAAAIAMYGTTTALTRRHADVLLASPSPIVIVGEEVRDERFNCVSFDVFNTVCSATEHLVRMGHRRIGFQCGPYERSARAEARLSGYLAALRAHGLERDDRLIHFTGGGVTAMETDHIGLGYRIAKSFCALDEPPTAILYPSDPYALGGVLALQSLGISVPDQMSVASCMEYPFSRQLTPRITTMRIPYTDISSRIMQFLQESIDQPPRSTPFRHVYPGELIVGETTAPRRG